MIPTDPRLGRIYRRDPRNADFPLSAAIPSGADLVDKTWPLARSRFLNQQQTPRCVGYSTAHDLACGPVGLTKITAEVADAIYVEAQRDDEWEGEDYEGSSVLGGSRALAKLGYSGEYRWAGEGGTNAADDVALALGHVGPVVFGTDWLSHMFGLTGGVLDVNGGLAGGHAYLGRWIAVSTRAKRSHLPAGAPLRDEPLIGGPNSWGTDWGNRGEWAMWLSDMRTLLAGVASPGEARVSTQPFRRAR
jgi:hypothetical protein